MMSFRHWLSGFYSQILLLKPAINQPRDRESKPVIHRPELCSMFEEQIIKIVGNMQSKYFIHTDTLTAGTQCKQSSFILCIFALVMPFNVSNTIIFAHWITHSHCRWYCPSHPVFHIHDFTFVFVCFSVCLWFCLNKQVFLRLAVFSWRLSQVAVKMILCHFDLLKNILGIFDERKSHNQAEIFVHLCRCMIWPQVISVSNQESTPAAGIPRKWKR